MNLIESNVIELKEKYTPNLIREIVSFINAEGGKIYIGIQDDGSIVGANDVDKSLRNISDIITSQIEPNAIGIVSSEIQTIEGKPVIVINVKKGIMPIYCIKKYGFSRSGCLIRVGTACMEMSESQINERYKEKFFNDDLLTMSPTNLPVLSFLTLKNYYLEKGYKLNDETFEANLKLLNASGEYNVMAELLSDNNRYSLIFVKFDGINKASISHRSDYGAKSILFGYRQLMNRIQAENICKTDTSVRPRIDTFLYDYNSVNEAVVNAIVHNDWTITEPQISFFKDRIEILSHGGLPLGLTEDEFYVGFSKPRNPQLMKIFSQLDIVDHTGHGVPIIVEKYGKKVFNIQKNYIIVSIPFNKSVVTVKKETNAFINDTEKKILEELVKNPKIKTLELSKVINKSKRTVERHLKVLKENNYIERVGLNGSGFWKVIK